MLVSEPMVDPIQASCAAYLLAGGKSSRMGENKAFLNFHGQTLLDRARTELTTACGSVTIVGDPATFAGYHPVISDIFPGCGPLAGIHAALTHSSAELNVMLAVDMPFVSADLLGFLLHAAEQAPAAATVPQIALGLQPLCAVYRRTFTPIAERALKLKQYKIDAAFANLPIHVIGEQELAVAGFSEKNFLNLNTPDDRRAADSIQGG